MRGYTHANSYRALQRAKARNKAVQCAKVINEWLTASSHFGRFESTGEVFPRGSTGKNSDLRECLVRFGGRTFTSKFCSSVIRCLLLEYGYQPIRNRGETWDAYVERQSGKMKTFVSKCRLASRAQRYRAWWKYWWEPVDMDNLDTLPMDVASSLHCLVLTLLYFI